MTNEIEEKIIEGLKLLLINEPDILSRVAAKKLAISHTTLNKLLKEKTGMTYKTFRRKFVIESNL